MAGTTDESDRFTAPKGARDEPEVEDAYERLVDEGELRLGRPLLPLVVTGVMAGFDVGVGVLAYLVVDAETGNSLLASVAFSIGFIALLLARSELFTENFLVPVTAVAARRGTVPQLIRLWVVTLLANLAGGFVMAALMVTALPSVRASAITVGEHYAHLGVSWRSFALAVLAGLVITLLTRMQHATEDLAVRLVPAVTMSFVLVGAQLFHSVLDSIFMFTALLTRHAGFGVGDWLLALLWSGFGNMVGGLVLVSALRLLRVTHRLAEDREDSGRS
jgi:formate/nitrite transporter FocA (FNT family)